MKFRLLAASAAAVVLLAGAAQAAFESGTMNVSATVEDECVINSVGAMAFGPIGGTADGTDVAQATISVTCNTDATYDVGLGAGSHGTGVTDRKMKSGETTLNYGLYRDANHTLNWGDTIDATAGDTQSGIGTGSEVDHTVYGKIPAQDIPTTGVEYTDSVAVTVTY